MDLLGLRLCIPIAKLQAKAEEEITPRHTEARGVGRVQQKKRRKRGGM